MSTQGVPDPGASHELLLQGRGVLTCTGTDTLHVLSHVILTAAFVVSGLSPVL